jgi:hypothetical protein
MAAVQQQAATLAYPLKMTATADAAHRSDHFLRSFLLQFLAKTRKTMQKKTKKKKQ